MRFAVALALVLTCAFGLDVRIAYADDELPERVGRVALVQGTLRHSTAEHADEWAEIGQNYPVAEGDNLWADRDARVEIDYGGGEVRLAGDTNLQVSRLTDRQLALFIASGRVIVRVRVLDLDDSVRIDTPATQIELARPGLYRIDVAADSPLTTLAVREGEAIVATTAGPAQVLPGQTAALSGVAGEPADIRAGGGIDGFDAWSGTRDRVYEQPRQYAYVSRQMVGAADLASYGTWQLYPDYGAVWFPTDVSPAWAPYRYGQWTWLPGWGYAWVDAAPWGYAPFHYGRWAYIGGRWGWCPGAFVGRPIWAPALVAWYGGPGWTLTGAGGPVWGWVPLGWREPFVPGWGRCSARCLARYNHPYRAELAPRDVPPTHFVNWSAPGGLTAVGGSVLAGGRPVASNRVSVAPSAFSPALVTRAPQTAPVAPLRPTLRPGETAPLPASVAAVHRPPVATLARDAGVAPPAAGEARRRSVPAVIAPPRRSGSAAVQGSAIAPPPASSAGSASVPIVPPASAGEHGARRLDQDDPASRIAPIPRSERSQNAAVPRPVAPASPPPGVAPSAAQAAPLPAPVLQQPRGLPAPVPPAAAPIPRSVPAAPGAVTPGPLPGAVAPGPLPRAVTPGPLPGAVAPGPSPGSVTPGPSPGAVAPSPRAPARVAPPNQAPDR